MENTVSPNQKRLYWLIFAVSTVLFVLLLMFWSEWFWVVLPFQLTYLVKALDWI
ncbi:MAG: hypothetical protein AAFP19_23010 [Bacteroidota bacterium]